MRVIVFKGTDHYIRFDASFKHAYSDFGANMFHVNSCGICLAFVVHKTQHELRCIVRRLVMLLLFTIYISFYSIRWKSNLFHQIEFPFNMHNDTSNTGICHL